MQGETTATAAESFKCLVASPSGLLVDLVERGADLPPPLAGKQMLVGKNLHPLDSRFGSSLLLEFSQYGFKVAREPQGFRPGRSRFRTLRLTAVSHG
jgi:hypothetical protein